MTETIASRPLPKRPANGFLAWQATVGYINSHYNLDTSLTIRVYPVANSEIRWSAQVAWGQRSEKIDDVYSLPEALRELWRIVERGHVIFESKEDMLKRPVNYDDDEWLDLETNHIVERLIMITQAVFKKDWRLLLIYNAVDNPSIRLQTRLLALDDAVKVGGHGSTLLDACRDLYRNAAREYVAHSGKSLDDILL